MARNKKLLDFLSDELNDLDIDDSIDLSKIALKKSPTRTSTPHKISTQNSLDEILFISRKTTDKKVAKILSKKVKKDKKSKK
jgi:hypothetical protein